MSREVQDNLDAEILPPEDAAVSGLLGGLKRVEAPANFERRVLSRIKEAEPQNRPRLRFSYVVALAVPLAILITAVIVINILTRQPAQRADVEANSVSNGQNIPAVTPTSNETSPEQNQFSASAKPPVTNPPSAESVPRTNAPSQPHQHVVQPTGGSYDEGVKSGKTILPRGVGNTDRPQANRDEMTGNTSVPVKDILLQLGITASYNAGWLVRTVENNSLAARSGVKVGDVVTALGKTALASDTEFKGSFEASTIKIKRNGQEKELPLK